MDESSYPMIDYKRVFSALWSHRKKFFIAWPITFVLASAFILCVPRTYVSTERLAIEYDLPGMSSLSSLASSLGFDLGPTPSLDAITPSLYPDLIETNEFLCRLSSVQVCDKDSLFCGSVYDYFGTQWRYPWWRVLTANTIGRLMSVLNPVVTNGSESAFLDPLRLSKKQTDVMELMRKKISCKFDKKNDVISITVEAQDPVIASSLADSVSSLLQEYIIDYRTNKARVDVEFYAKLCEQTRAEMENARIVYSQYVDSHVGGSLQQYQSQSQQLEADWSMLQSAYRAYQTQLHASEVKLQERTPAFSVLQGAVQPLRPTKPKRVFFVLEMLALVTFCLAIWCVKDILLNTPK